MKTTFFQSHIICLFLTCITCSTLNACNNGPEKGKVYRTIAGDKSVKPTFKQHWGKSFTEVKRTFKNGVSFSDYGYQLRPEWRFKFLNDDSVNIYNPVNNTWGNAPMQFDHDSIFNIAWAYMRLKKLTKDSIIFQVLKVEGRLLTRDESVVYMTLYNNDYIKNNLHTTPGALIHPSKKDTAYIKQMAVKANADTAKAFAGLIPVNFKAKNPLITVTRQNTTAENKKESGLLEDYLLPEFDVVIHKAYEDFSYSFTMTVDEKGKLYYKKNVNFSFTEFEAETNKTIRAIVDGYLTGYLSVTPGSTLGMPHSSVVVMHVKGIKSK